MENPIKTDDLGGKPTIFGNTRFTTPKTVEFSKERSPKLDEASHTMGILDLKMVDLLGGFVPTDVTRMLLGSL